MPQHGEVEHGDDERDARAERGAKRRAVEDVRAARGARQPSGYQSGVAQRRRRAAATAPRELAQLDVLRQMRAQALDVARRAGAREPERRDVERDLHAPSGTRAARLARARHVNRARVLEPARRARRALARLVDPAPDVGRILRIDAHGGVSCGLVQRRMVRADDRRPARHRLDDRHPEPLEARREDEHGRTAVEARQLVVRDVVDDAHAETVEHVEVLPRLARADREHVLARLALALRREARIDAWVRDARLDAELLAHVARRELRDREHRRPRASSPRSSGRAAAACAGATTRGSAAARGRTPSPRAHARALRHVQPVGEVEDVEVADDPLEVRAPHAPTTPRASRRRPAAC